MGSKRQFYLLSITTTCRYRKSGKQRIRELINAMSIRVPISDNGREFAQDMDTFFEEIKKNRMKELTAAVPQSSVRVLGTGNPLVVLPPKAQSLA
ncbi:hypothetical protein KIN20_016124 [Parelaphostrongylus tenuis]|uniref:Uncharacterized protein n=1 Tax=Parelaphostrongylus tenuis TaxID=148309 RepID=A0AAD5QQH0_PARTN|nr:hypothetical protein KIN20_016124 [Parelaphostrongylus tenuis]